MSEIDPADLARLRSRRAWSEDVGADRAARRAECAATRAGHLAVVVAVGRGAALRALRRDAEPGRAAEGGLQARAVLTAHPLGLSPGVDLLDQYTGHVEPAGPAARRDLQDVSITKVSVGPMDNNAYVLVDKATGQALLIDAANETDRLLDTVDTVASRDKLSALATTHKHWDHIQSLEDVVGAVHPSTYAHEKDAPELPVTPDRMVGDDDTVSFGNSFVEIIHLDGHTPGSIALLYRDPAGSAHLFTGDSLFPGGHGKTATLEHHESLMNDLEHKVFSRLDDDTHVYPGHGDDTTLGTERPHLSEWRERGW